MRYCGSFGNMSVVSASNAKGIYSIFMCLPRRTNTMHSTHSSEGWKMITVLLPEKENVPQKQNEGAIERSELFRLLRRRKPYRLCRQKVKIRRHRVLMEHRAVKGKWVVAVVWAADNSAVKAECAPVVPAVPVDGRGAFRVLPPLLRE